MLHIERERENEKERETNRIGGWITRMKRVVVSVPFYTVTNDSMKPSSETGVATTLNTSKMKFETFKSKIGVPFSYNNLTSTSIMLTNSTILIRYLEYICAESNLLGLESR